MDVEDAIDRLYSLPLEEFTAARNALAKELAGDDAKRVKALRKPTLSAWAVNQAVRAEPGLLEALLGAGGELRQAHRQATRGGGTQLRDAARSEREAVEALAAAARKAAGKRAGEPFMDRVRETLHAASLDEEARDVVAAGRVVNDLRAVGLGAVGGARTEHSPVGRPSAGVPSRGSSVRASEAPARAPRVDPRPLRREVKAAERAVASAETRVENAKEVLDEAKAELKEQQARLRKATAALKKAEG